LITATTAVLPVQIAAYYDHGIVLFKIVFTMALYIVIDYYKHICGGVLKETIYIF